MANILAVSSYGTDDPTRASFAFLNAIGALGAGKEVSIVLLGEAVYLIKEEIAKTVQGVGFPPLLELIEKVIEANVPVHV